MQKVCVCVCVEGVRPCWCLHRASLSSPLQVAVQARTHRAVCICVESGTLLPNARAKDPSSLQRAGFWVATAWCRRVTQSYSSAARPVSHRMSSRTRGLRGLLLCEHPSPSGRWYLARARRYRTGSALRGAGRGSGFSTPQPGSRAGIGPDAGSARGRGS